MKLGSLFSGSGGFELAGIYAGMTPLWASEVEPYPIAVTRHRLPGMKHLGDLPMAETFSDDEISFWEGVRRTHAQIMNKKYTKAKTTAALVNWYNKLHTDSAEYKMWGNGIALPCARFVLEGIAMALKGEIK